MKIFLVDDSSFMLLFCKQILNQGGHEVVGEAFDGQQAVDEFSNSDAELILMDVALPKKNGLEVAKEILKKHPHMKIIAMSALEEHWIAEKSKEAGCVSFLGKPFDAKTLLQAVADTVSQGGEVKYG